MSLFDLDEMLRKPNGELWVEDTVKLGSDAPYLDGHYCTQCREPIADDDLVGPINVRIKDPEVVGPEGIEREFCTWECFADWAAVQAGRASHPRALRNPSQ